MGLPLFVYGSLQSGEIAHDLISPYIEKSEKASVKGAVLGVRDGFPLLDINSSKWGESNTVHGELFYARQGLQKKFRGAATNYEARSFYKRVEIEVLVNQQSVKALAFVGMNFERDDVETLHSRWQLSEIPLFKYGFPSLAREIDNFNSRFTPEPPDFPTKYWPQMVRAEGNFLALCSIFEYLLTLKYGLYFYDDDEKDSEKAWKELSVNSKITRLGNDPNWVRIVEESNFPSLVVYDTRKFKTSYSTSNPKQAAKAWYAVRSNLTHRGKSSTKDFDKINKATEGLHVCLRQYLVSLFPDIEKKWADIRWT